MAAFCGYGKALGSSASLLHVVGQPHDGSEVALPSIIPRLRQIVFSNLLDVLRAGYHDRMGKRSALVGLPYF
jgi:hypothetical protein